MLTRVSPGAGRSSSFQAGAPWSDRQVPRRWAALPAGTAATPRGTEGRDPRARSAPALSSGGLPGPPDHCPKPLENAAFAPASGETRVHRWRNAGSSYLEDVG